MSAYRTVLCTLLLVAYFAPPVLGGIEDDLLAHFPLDGDAADATANGFDGTVSGAVPTSDRFGNASGALFFDGDDGVLTGLDMSTQFGVGDPVTFSLWIQTTMTPPDVRVFQGGAFPGGGPDFTAGLFPDGRAFVRLYGGIQATSAAIVNDGRWHHLAWGTDGSTTFFFVDGVPQTESPTIGSFNRDFITYGSARITDRFIVGSIDDGRIYSRGLSVEEIEELVFGPPRPCLPAPAGLVSWWPGDGDAGDIQGSNHGTLRNGASFAPGFVGEAFSFDGIDDFVDIPDDPSLALAAEFTVDFWFSPRVTFDSSDPTAPGFLSKGAFESINLANNDGRIEVRGPFPRPNSTTNTWLAGVWYQAVVTFDSTGYKVYVNGVLEGGVASGHSIFANADDVRIGSIPGFTPAGVTFNGLIDEVEIFDRALPESEIRDLYDARRSGKCKDADGDGDGVDDADDLCPGTAIPESVPLRELGTLRWALVDGDGIFDTRLPPGGGPDASFTIEDTAGCSCEQIIEGQDLGFGHRLHGCSLSAMRDWIALVNNR